MLSFLYGLIISVLILLPLFLIKRFLKGIVKRFNKKVFKIDKNAPI